MANRGGGEPFSTMAARMATTLKVPCTVEHAVGAVQRDFGLCGPPRAPHRAPHRNELSPNTAAKHPNRAATVREWNHHQIAAPEVPMVHGI